MMSIVRGGEAFRRVSSATTATLPRQKVTFVTGKLRALRIMYRVSGTEYGSEYGAYIPGPAIGQGEVTERCHEVHPNKSARPSEQRRTEDRSLDMVGVQPHGLAEKECRKKDKYDDIGRNIDPLIDGGADGGRVGGEVINYRDDDSDHKHNHCVR